MKNISAYILGIIALFATMACSKEAEDTIVTIDREVKVYLSSTQDLVTGPGWIQNLHCYTNDTCKLQFKSNDENIVAVNEDGNYEGVNPGKTTIDVTTVNGTLVQSFNVEVPPFGISTTDDKNNIIETKEIKSIARFNGSFTLRGRQTTSEIILLSEEENKDWSNVTDIEKYFADPQKGEHMIYKYEEMFDGVSTSYYCIDYSDFYPTSNIYESRNPIQNNNGIYTIFVVSNCNIKSPYVFYKGEIKQLN